MNAAAWKTPYDLFEERRSASSGHQQAQSQTSSSSIEQAFPANVADTINVRGIDIAGWRIESQRGSIADSKTIDALSDAWGIPLPEMPFDKNRLVLSHVKSGWQYVFDGLSALRSVEGVEASHHLEGLDMHGMSATAAGPSTRSRRNVLGEKPKSKRVQVSYANEWGKKRNQQSQAAAATSMNANSGAEQASHFGPEVAAAAASGAISTARDYDWTYSCHWPGCEMHSSRHAFALGTDPARDRIPLERLGAPTAPGAKAEPILFFDDVVLYEDELGDNGTSMLGVKVRVMPTGFLVLQRFFLRVDNVMFRVFDTRMYVAFYEDDVYTSSGPGASRGTSAPTTQMAGLSLGAASGTSQSAISGVSPPLVSTPRIIRECTGSQVPYADIKARLPPYKPNDLSMLTDVGWVSQQMTKIDEERERRLWQKMQSQSSALHPGTMVSKDAQADPTSPAVLPSTTMPGTESNRILGEVADPSADGEDEPWEGQGHRVDVLDLNA